MLKILFMPFLQIPSGHHHVADCIQDQLIQTGDQIQCEKIELLSSSFGKVENLVSFIYLQWIHKLPGVYSSVYKRLAVKQEKHNKHYYLYEFLFQKYIQRILAHSKPDLIICTHALPSYLLSRLIKKGLWSGIVINVYTDYFINDLWGLEQIHYHFTPSIDVKMGLIERGIKEENIIVTGIPVHPLFKSERRTDRNEKTYTVLISGGNMGAGSIEKLLRQLNPSGTIRYQVLCGKNENLFLSIKRLGNPFIQALPYLESKEDMCGLYDMADAIITKPGGVTISECLWKRLPIFVYEALPGQEELNLNYLKSQGLIFHLDQWKSKKNLEHIITEHLTKESPQYQESANNYINNLKCLSLPEFCQELQMK
ncbi:MGDG synthase family glycosyltransferase [Oceanobacillus rekensis]|uniref:MGDG synthase family glycosyltransferase n=1 Tax=Oceanobacillus rekensis TaxID=937927 RepID=UPI000B450C1C|nr:glycosyltransferase [Oceanobacillus rekensis]